LEEIGQVEKKKIENTRLTINLLGPNSKKGIDYYDTIHDQKVIHSRRYME
jgi:hypothetical protein